MFDRINDALSTDFINIPSLYHGETASSVISHVFLCPHHRSSDARMDRGIQNQALTLGKCPIRRCYLQNTYLFMSNVKKGPMVYTRIVRESSTEHFWIPRIFPFMLASLARSMEMRGGGLTYMAIKWITETGPQCSYVDLRADRVVVWSPPSATILGTWPFDGFAGDRLETTLRS